MALTEPEKRKGMQWLTDFMTVIAAGYFIRDVWKWWTKKPPPKE
jgi:hypothetical protein